jgi:hypothetical protein
MIRFICPACQQQYTVPDAAGGKKTNCRGCGQKLQVPGAVNKPVLGTLVASDQIGEAQRPPPAEQHRPSSCWEHGFVLQILVGGLLLLPCVIGLWMVFHTGSPSDLYLPRKGDPDETQIKECINKYLKDQERGDEFASHIYWESGAHPVTFFAVRGWTLLDRPITFIQSDSTPTAFVKARIDSSTKGGMQITKVWTFHMRKTGGKWKIGAISGQTSGD